MFQGLPVDYFRFFRELKSNNTKEWFEDNKPRYRASVQEPLAGFVEAMAPQLKSISKHFVADPRLNGGSVFRIYRDVRFSKDKSPYKTHGAVHFRHALGKDAHAPGFYVHLDPDEVFFGAGIWVPPGPSLLKIREAIRDKPKAWEKATKTERFMSRFGSVRGDSLKRPPRGFSEDDLYIEDLKRKSFFGLAESSPKAAQRQEFCDDVAEVFLEAKPLMLFLGKALDIPV